MVVPNSGRSLWFVTQNQEGWKNSGNTCFVNAALQLMLRLQPFYEVLHHHKEKCGARDECMLCLACVEGRVLRGLAPTGRMNRLAVLARQGQFGDEYKGFIDTSTRKTSRAKAFARECDAHDFMCSFISKIAFAEKSAAPRHTAPLSVLEDELLGGVTRQRFHHLAEGCMAPTRDVCFPPNFYKMKLPMELPVGQRSVALGDLWRTHWGVQRPEAASARDASSCCQGIAENLRQDYLEKEPLCLLLTLDRVGPGETKLVTAVDFPEYIDFMQSGRYECVGALLHHGTGLTTGHFTPVCKVAWHGEFRFVHFNDSKTTYRPWTFLASPEVRREVYILLYLRMDVHEPTESGDVSMCKPCVVGVDCRKFREKQMSIAKTKVNASKRNEAKIAAGRGASAGPRRQSSRPSQVTALTNESAATDKRGVVNVEADGDALPASKRLLSSPAVLTETQKARVAESKAEAMRKRARKQASHRAGEESKRARNGD